MATAQSYSSTGHTGTGASRAPGGTGGLWATGAHESHATAAGTGPPHTTRGQGSEIHNT
jgi:hypothetical protein